MRARALLLSLGLALTQCQPAASPVHAPEADPNAEYRARVDWIQARTLPLHDARSTDPDLSDLSALREIVGDAHVVALGEPSHGDGDTFLAKARVVRFLHEALGFEVLAMESGFVECDRAWAAIASGHDAVDANRRCMYGMWAESAEMRPLVRYIGAQSRGASPLVLSGFDLRLRPSPAPDAFTTELRNALGDSPSLQTLGPAIDRIRDAHARAAPEDVDLVLHALQLARAQLLAQQGPALDSDAANFWLQAIASTEAWARWMAEEAPLDPQTSPAKRNNARDEQMAKNLLWLLENRFRDEKVVVWAANLHIAREMTSLRELDGTAPFHDMVPMGEWLSRALGRDYVALAFTAHDGSAAPTGKAAETIAPPPRGSLEDLLNAGGIRDGFLPLRLRHSDPAWLREPLASIAFGYEPTIANWPAVFDGLVFRKTMHPSTTAHE